MRRLFPLALVMLAGCKSPYIEATIHNATGTTIHTLQIEYPSASFGTQTLAPDADFHYRFKIQGEGKMKLTYTAANHQDIKSTGPTLYEGQSGTLTLTLPAASDPQWQLAVTPTH